mgnify:CR=1 FL=1|jgi:hypothetical protein
MKPWTVILRESPDSAKPSYTREVNLPLGAREAWDKACYLYGKVNILAILPGSFKNRVCNGFISNNP